jgi:putative acetyltransferase
VSQPLHIRQPRTSQDEQQAILDVHRAAFDREDEARLVQQLCLAGRNRFERLAEQDGQIVAHVLFSPVRIAQGDDGKVLGLAPMAVVPAWQRRGMGAALLRESLQALRSADFRAVVVLGDPAYYSRFGFAPASQQGLIDTYGGGDAFMALALREGALDGYRGQVDYAPEFANLTD